MGRTGGNAGSVYFCANAKQLITRMSSLLQVLATFHCYRFGNDRSCLGHDANIMR